MKNKFYLLILFQLFISISLFGQRWNKLDNGVNGEVMTVYFDSTDLRLYIGGPFSMFNNTICRQNAFWDGQNWQCMGMGQTFGLWVKAIIKYQNKIFSDGRFVLDPNNFSGYFDGNSWDSLGLGVNGPIYDFKIINGILWAAGRYNKSGGDSCSMLSTWDGQSWSCINNQFDNEITSFLFYHDTLIIAGNMFEPNGWIGVAWYNGSSFQRMGVINNSFAAGINCMVIYRDELYIGGYILKQAGNAGDFIMKWDGQQWVEVPDGPNGEIWCMKVYNDELYVGGYFTKTGNKNASMLAKYNGVEWNTVSDEIIDGTVEDIDFYNNHMYIGGAFHNIGNNLFNFVADYFLLPDSVPNLNNEVQIFPNPGSGYFYFKSLTYMNSFNIFDILGKNISQGKINSKNLSIDLSNLPGGCYFVEIITESGNTMQRICIQ